MGGGSSTELAGVRVFKVTPGGPAAEAGLEVYFDFVVEINGTSIDNQSKDVFATKIAESEGKVAKLMVYNTRAHTKREVAVTPRKWGGTGLLGATIRFDVVDPAENQGIRVLEVFPNSPAAHAGLVPYLDYLLGTAQSVFHDIDELVDVVTTSINKKLQVYVYNADTESVREVTLVPNNDWGGDGCIGCDIGAGLLHKIPAPRRPPGSSVAPPVAAGGFQTIAYPPGVSAPGPVVGAPGVVPGAAPVVPGFVPAPAAQVVVPGVTAVPGVPGLPGVPAVPGVPALPGVPGVPGVPVLTAAPAVPVPGVPGVPAALGVQAAVPGIPVAATPNAQLPQMQPPAPAPVSAAAPEPAPTAAEPAAPPAEAQQEAAAVL